MTGAQSVLAASVAREQAGRQQQRAAIKLDKYIANRADQLYRRVSG